MRRSYWIVWNFSPGIELVLLTDDTWADSDRDFPIKRHGGTCERTLSPRVFTWNEAQTYIRQSREL